MMLANPTLSGGSIFLVFTTLVVLLKGARKNILLYGGLIGLTLLILITFPIVLLIFKFLNFLTAISLRNEKVLIVTKENYKDRLKLYKSVKKGLSSLNLEKKEPSSKLLLTRWIEKEIITHRDQLIFIEETLRNQLYLSFPETLSEDEIQKNKAVLKDFAEDWDSDEDDIYDELYYEEARN